MVTPVSITHEFNGDAAAANLVDAAQLDTQLGNLAATVNAEIAERQRTVRDGSGLAPQVVRYPALHPEILTALSGMTFLEDVKAATTVNDTLTGLAARDGYTPIAGDRMLVIAQTNAVENGVYVAAAGAWSRSADFTGAQTTTSAVAVLNGTAYAGTIWRMSANATIGSTTNSWIQIQGFASLLPITRGGTGANNAASARTNLGLGTVATLSAIAQANLAADVYYQVDTIAALKALTSGTHDAVAVRGYYAAGDTDLRVYRWNGADATADNGGTVIAPTVGSGRWNLQHGGVISLRWFGAKGDGATDDTAFVTAALAAMPIGGTLLVPSGSAFLVGDLSVPSFITITGGGTLKFKTNTAAFSLLALNTVTDVVVTGITFDGNITNQSVWSQFRHCLKVLSSTRVKVFGNTFKNIVGDGVYVSHQTAPATPSDDVVIDGNTFTATNDNRNGISLINCKNVRITANHFNRMARDDMPGAIALEPDASTETITGVIIEGNTFVGKSGTAAVLQQAVAVQNVSDAPILDITIANNYIVGDWRYGIALFSGATNIPTVSITGNRIKSLTMATAIGIINQGCFAEIRANTIANIATSGIKCVGGTHMIVGNRLRDIGTYGIEQTSVSDTGIISCNDFIDCGTNSVATYGCMQIAGSNHAITGNRGFSSGATKSQQGIYIPTGTYNYIDGNHFYGTFLRTMNAVGEQLWGVNTGNGGFPSISGAVPPTAGTWQRGQRCSQPLGTPGKPTDYVCTVAGTPGTWVQCSHTPLKGVTGSRPTLAASDVGVLYFDTTLDADGKTIWWTGTAWVDATGAVV